VKLVYYSLLRPNHGSYDSQWLQSIRSLRLYNRELPVCLLAYNGLSNRVLREADRSDVMVYFLGHYRDCLERIYPRGPVLTLYPTLHKFISLSELDTSGISQVLYLDCDTFFFDDPAILFDNYNSCDWYAREAPTSRRCPHGYDPSNIDEEALESIAEKEKITFVHPFNAGVCLMNNGVWRTLERLYRTLLDNVWRLLVGRHQRKPDGSDNDIRRAVLTATTKQDRVRALPYPSNNFWLADEIGLWLTLGRIPGFSQGFFQNKHVVQGFECTDTIERGDHWVAGHYFSSAQSDFFACVQTLSA
jgi:hypothetical protein